MTDGDPAHKYGADMSRPAYSRLRRLLADELGVDPDARLQSLELQVLQHSPDMESTGPQTVDAISRHD
jgi:DNA-binding SARP family transcriptional activator